MRYNEKKDDWVFQDMNFSNEMNRRDFMRKIGGGLIVAISVSNFPLQAGYKAAEDDEPGVNAYLRIGEDGQVTLYTGKIDMGQGAITSLPMMLADELDVNIESIDIIMGDTDLCPWHQGTHGSTAIRIFGQILRAAGARARAIHVQSAAEELSVDADQLEVTHGLVYSRQNTKISVSYAELTKGKEILETLEGEIPLKQASEFKIMGTSRLHQDAYEKVCGKAMYSGDIQLPGMMRARILRPPTAGAKLISVDTSDAENIEGVEVVRDGDLIAVLHESQDMADFAITRIKAEFEADKTDVDNDSIYHYLTEKATESKEISSDGELSEGEKNSDKLFDMEYLDPYLAHAPIENHTSTAVFEDGKLKIWTSSQGQRRYS